jgi:thioredoxin-like negative regulator of GroEL
MDIRRIALSLSLAALTFGRAFAVELTVPTTATTDAKFQQDVLDASADHLVVVVFGAAWCLPCGGVVGTLSYAAQQKSFGVVTMDVDANPVMADKLKVSSTLPVVIAFRGGMSMGSHIGPWTDRDTIDTFLARVGA